MTVVVELSSLLFSTERLALRGVSVFEDCGNGGAMQTTGGGGDGLDDIVEGSASMTVIDTGDISTKSLGECVGERTRVFFGSLAGTSFEGGIDFFFDTTNALLGVCVKGVLLTTTFGFDGIDSFLTGGVGFGSVFTGS